MLWFLLLLMATSHAASGNKETLNLEGCSFIFPRESLHDYVELHPLIDTFFAVTVCVRVKTDLCRSFSLFSASTQHVDNAVLMFWDDEHEEFEVFINGHKTEFKGLTFDLNKWHSVCITWDSATGLVQLFFDGHKTIKEFAGRDKLKNLKVLLGQEQDTYGGGFTIGQSFVGEETDVHMWDYVIDDCEIQNYMEYQNFCPGNALNWRKMTFELYGKAVKGFQQICTQDDAHVVYPEISAGSDYQYYSNDFSPSSGYYPRSGKYPDFGHYGRGYRYGRSYFGKKNDLYPTGHYGLNYSKKGRNYYYGYYRRGGYHNKYDYGSSKYYKRKSYGYKY